MPGSGKARSQRAGRVRIRTEMQCARPWQGRAGLQGASFVAPSSSQLQGQIPALTGLFVPSSPDSGTWNSTSWHPKIRKLQPRFEPLRDAMFLKTDKIR